nr:uncharacterized protein LOC111510617 [Leptinotarsa decemlineata]
MSHANKLIFCSCFFRAACWLRLCNREDLLGKSIQALHRNFRVCEKHFAKEVISQSGIRKHLFQNAVPSIFPHSAPKRSLEVIDNDNCEGPPKKIAVLGDITSNIAMHAETVASPAATDISDIKIDYDGTADENEIVENKDEFWTFPETSALVEAYGHHIKSFAEDGHELPTWNRISTELSSKNIHRSPESCERKWESLVQKHNSCQTNYEYYNESDDVSNAQDEGSVEQSSKKHKGDCECYKRKIVEKQKRHRERMDLIKRKLEIEERKLAAFEKYLAHLSTVK